MRLLTPLLATLMACLPLASQAQGTYPARAIRLVVPAPPGGGADALARAVATALTDQKGWTVVVDNKSGAGGNIAGAEVARATPDGYTFLLGDSGQLAINPSLYKSMAFDPQKDFTPVAYVADFPFLMVAGRSATARTVADLIAQARKAPGAVAYASTGVGTPQHLGGHLFATMAGVQLLHTPYRGGAPATAALLGGEVPIGFVGLPPMVAQVRGGKLHALAISSKERSALLPDVPTMAESGLPGYEAKVWFGWVGPAGLPAPIVQTVSKALADVLKNPAMDKRLADLGLRGDVSGPESLSKIMRSEAVKWAEVVKSSGASSD